MAAPLVPADVIIPRLPWVPVYADRLWDSNFWGVATDAEFRAAFCLWLKCWTQKPPGSLPTNDRLLCRLAELNGNLAKWRKVKRIALWHWVECDDGRLYHPVIAEFIIDASIKLNANRRRTISATENRWKSTKDRSVTVSVTDTDLKGTGNPPLYPPHDGGGDEGLFKNGLGARTGNGLSAPGAVNPKIIGHALPCACPNCTRWVEQQRAA